VARHTASRMEAASAASTRAAPSRRYATLRRTWRGQALPGRGLPQGSSRRHTPLRGAWGRQALPEGGLLQASRSSSRQCVLQAMYPARAARRCVGRYIATAWRGPAAPSHGWVRARTPAATAGGERGATHRLATVVMCNVYTTYTIYIDVKPHTCVISSLPRRAGTNNKGVWRARHSGTPGIARSTVAASLTRPALLAVRWPHL
jgi:hypothetical protein